MGDPCQIGGASSREKHDGEILSPRFKITASARSFDVALEGRSSGTGGSFGFYTSTRMDQRFMDFE